MKKFNQIITVEVSVDSIATQLLSTINTDEKHRELIAETVIGSLLQSSVGMSQLYNSLNGYTNEIDFQIGDNVVYQGTHYSHSINEDGTVSEESSNVPYGTVQIVAIDLYRTSKLQIEYDTTNYKGVSRKCTTWVSHLKCSKVSINENLLTK